MEAEIVTHCGECHEPGGIAGSPFLAGPDRYESIVAWPGIVVKDPAQSSMVTWSVSGGGHTGTNLDTIDGDLLARVRAWLEVEAASVGDETGPSPHVDPFAPIMGFNAVYLSTIDPALQGVAITFMAEELTPTTLKLGALNVYTTAQTGLHVVHPVFAVYPAAGEPEADPVDSFSGLDQRFPESTGEPLGAGVLILTNWQAGAKLGIGFEVIEPWSEGSGEGGAGGGSGAGCVALEEFDVAARPQFQQRCATCHGGNNGQATAAVDMSELATSSAAACSQIKNRVNLATPIMSQIFIVTDPTGNSAHPFKFGGDQSQFSTFRTQVTTWIEAE
jgi:mono/diheme cytochrome c family protein